jgi:hypothetical protein
VEDPPETVEETIVKREVVEVPSGWRLVYSLALTLIGLGLIALGVFMDLRLGVRIPLIIGGIGLTAAFGYVLVGARHIGGSKNVPSADIPQGSTVRTTVTRRGFPKHGRSPLDTRKGEGGSPPAEPTSGGFDDSGL